MASTATTSREDIKVVLIDTRYIETDLHSFKSVVQRLRGKDCCVSWIDESSFSCSKTGTNNVAGKVAAEGSYGTAATGCSYSGGAGGGRSDVDRVSTLTKGLSFKDLDRLIMEAPPLDELNWLWAEY
ncbi:putative Glucan endo-1,3-beta-glucosidase precursor [Hibiscus syriacus]|uniref:Glucan endo-1,3-beta-glucosidase n=1 Tax=Hibiscus syriacus TaxID=106335 RepID=A0A6A2XCE5_HIBSY|nr:VQ motif-containing protein 10-like [Hibiscus syriacus]KAE8673341.1 putative Glucan endo-1,3-beta-glucosidase precursor [Hibiscus syriacus]